MLDGNPHALGNVAWGLAVAQQLRASLLQQARPGHGSVVLCGCETCLLHVVVMDRMDGQELPNSRRSSSACMQ